MTWLERFALALLLCVAFFLLARPAFADESIARRLAALRSLVEPTPLAVTPVPRARGFVCSDASWWRVSDHGLAARTDAAVRDASLRFGVDADLIHSVIRTESAYDPEAVSHKGAMGLMQLMPLTARSVGVVCPFDPRENILGGTRYLRAMYERLGSWERALAAYHAGPTRVESGRIPGETRRYVGLVMRRWRSGGRPWEGVR